MPVLPTFATQYDATTPQPLSQTAAQIFAVLLVVTAFCIVVYLVYDSLINPPQPQEKPPIDSVEHDIQTDGINMANSREDSDLRFRYKSYSKLERAELNRLLGNLNLGSLDEEEE